MNQSREVVTWKVNGFLMLLVHLVLLVAGAVLVLAGHLLGVILLILFFVTLPGYTLIQPNEARVLLFLGNMWAVSGKTGFSGSIRLLPKKRSLYASGISKAIS